MILAGSKSRGSFHSKGDQGRSDCDSAEKGLPPNQHVPLSMLTLLFQGIQSPVLLLFSSVLPGTSLKGI